MEIDRLVRYGSGKDEFYGNFFTCPNCGSKFIFGVSNYCSDCGIKLLWPDDLKKIKGYEKDK